MALWNSPNKYDTRRDRLCDRCGRWGSVWATGGGSARHAPPRREVSYYRAPPPVELNILHACAALLSSTRESQSLLPSTIAATALTSISRLSPRLSISIVARAGTASSSNQSAQAPFIAGLSAMSVTYSVYVATPSPQPPRFAFQKDTRTHAHAGQCDGSSSRAKGE
jgi:hypothetical protein